MGACGCRHCGERRAALDRAGFTEETRQGRAEESTEHTQEDRSRQARKRWKTVFGKIKLLIRMRLKWHRLGVYLQDPAIQELFLGMERVQGLLTRRKTADQARAAKLAKQRRP